MRPEPDGVVGDRTAPINLQTFVKVRATTKLSREVLSDVVPANGDVR